MSDSEFERIKCFWAPCSVEVVPTKRWQKFCSNRCRMAYANERRKQAMALLGDWPITMPSLASAGMST